MESGDLERWRNCYVEKMARPEVHKDQGVNKERETSVPQQTSTDAVPPQSERTCADGRHKFH